MVIYIYKVFFLGGLSVKFLDKKNSMRIISTLILILVITGITFYVSGKELTEEKWLEKNSSSLDIEDNEDFATFNISKEDLENNEVFLTGEFHGVNVNNDLDLKFLKFFKKKAGIKYYLVELSPSKGILLNKYLETGNEVFIDKFMIDNYMNGIWNKEFYDKWKRIYEFNNGLEDDEKIKVLCLDPSGNIDSYFMSLNMFIDEHEKQSDEVIQKFTELYTEYEKTINDSNFYDYVKLYKEVEEKILKLREDIKNRKEFYENYFKEDFHEFVYILDNFYYYLHIQNLGAIKNEEAVQYREDKMYENFKYIYSKLPEGKYYGHFGDYHVLKEGYHIGKFLDKDKESPVQGKVLSIFNEYVNSSTLNFNNRSKNERLYPMFNEELLSLIEPLKESNNMLFKVKGKRSPFNNKDLNEYLGFYYQTFIKENENIKKPVSDYFDYLVVNYDAEGSTPYKVFESNEEGMKYEEEINDKFNSLIIK